MDNGKLKTFKVSGNSMNPLLADGDQILVKSVPEYKVGDIVVSIHPIQSDLTMVKRIESIEKNGLRLRGINAQESTDKFGIVDYNKIIGKMIATLD
jgi:nickel-type superoxide dismutase maturation protease